MSQIFWRPKPYDQWTNSAPSLIDLLAAGVVSDDDEGEEDEVEIDDEMDNDDDQ